MRRYCLCCKESYKQWTPLVVYCRHQGLEIPGSIPSTWGIDLDPGPTAYIVKSLECQ